MGHAVTVSLSDTTLDQVERLAGLYKQELSQVVEDLLRHALANSFAAGHGPVEDVEQVDDEMPAPSVISDPAVDRELAAYQQLHSVLWQRYPNQHVAIHDGQLVDHDTDGVALSLRIYQHYPDQFVLLRQVEEQAETLLRVRSPRFNVSSGAMSSIASLSR